MRKANYKLTQESIRDNGIVIIENPNEVGQHEVYQYVDPIKKTFRTRRPIYVNTKPHPYGNDKSYLLIAIRLKEEDGSIRWFTVPLHKLLYIYYYGNYPEGYAIAHKDDDGFNCYKENLEAMSYKDNNRNKKFYGNQYGRYQNTERCE